MIIVLDCNIWITLTINSQIDFIPDLSDSGTLIAGCTTLRYEIETVLNRPKFLKYISGDDIKKVLELYDLVTTHYKPARISKVTNYLKDDYLFALAVKAKADFLVTRDKLLLDVAKYKNTQIINLTDFRIAIK